MIRLPGRCDDRLLYRRILPDKSYPAALDDVDFDGTGVVVAVLPRTDFTGNGTDVAATILMHQAKATLTIFHPLMKWNHHSRVGKFLVC
jgi:hypothetical protein